MRIKDLKTYAEITVASRAMIRDFGKSRKHLGTPIPFPAWQVVIDGNDFELLQLLWNGTTGRLTLFLE